MIGKKILYFNTRKIILLARWSYLFKNKKHNGKRPFRLGEMGSSSKAYAGRGEEGHPLELRCIRSSGPQSELKDRRISTERLTGLAEGDARGEWADGQEEGEHSGMSGELIETVIRKKQRTLGVLVALLKHTHAPCSLETSLVSV